MRVRGWILWPATGALIALFVDAQTGSLALWSRLSVVERTIAVALTAAPAALMGTLRALQAVMPFVRTWQSNRRISAAFTGPGAPERAPNAAIWQFHIKAPGKIPEILNGLIEASHLREAITGRPVKREFLKVGDDIDAELTMAQLHAMNTRGLTFLNDQMRNAIIWNIVIDRLTAAGSTTPVINAAKGRLEALQEGELYRAPFSHQRCAKVSMTPVPEGETYFTWYLQPLLVAFDEERFQESAGMEATDALHAVMSHLNALAGNRVAAARFDLENTNCDGALVRPILFKPEPGGPQRRSERRTARIHNQKKAAKSILIVTGDARWDATNAFDRAYDPAKRMADAGRNPSVWTPFLDGHSANGCHLWQCD